MPKIIDEENIFKTIVQMFITLGYHGIKTKEIAKQTGINEATLFRKYGNKLNLIKKAFDFQFSNVPLNKIIYTGNLKVDLYEILNAYISTNNSMGDILPMILLEIPRFPELESILQMALVNIEKIEKIIERYQREGQLKKEDPILSTNVLLSPLLLNNMISRANISIPKTSINLDDYIDMFLSGRK